MQQHLPFTVLKRYRSIHNLRNIFVATAPTVYGIETENCVQSFDGISLLQQHLPFTVLKHHVYRRELTFIKFSLQQHLPFTVLKLYIIGLGAKVRPPCFVATAPTVYGIETEKQYEDMVDFYVATAPTVYGIETSFTA